MQDGRDRRRTPAVGYLSYRLLSRGEGGITLAALTAISGEARRPAG
jgi:hypothetical protein